MMRKLKKKYSPLIQHSSFHFQSIILIKEWKLFNTDNKGMELMGISVQRIVYMSIVDRCPYYGTVHKEKFNLQEKHTFLMSCIFPQTVKFEYKLSARKEIENKNGSKAFRLLYHTLDHDSNKRIYWKAV